MAIDVADFQPNVRCEPHATRGGIAIHFTGGGIEMSPSWEFGGFEVRFVAVPGNQSLRLDLDRGQVFAKVITGSIDSGAGVPFPPSGTLADTRILEPEVLALSDSIVCILTETPDAAPVIRDMSVLRVNGPMQEVLSWQTFAEKFAGVTDLFDGLEAHMVPGFHLLDTTGTEIAYVHFWTTGKGVDVSTHNHGQDPTPRAPAFAEVHLVLRNGTGAGGMYLRDSPDAQERQRLPMQVGQQHGPFFAYDEETRKPRLRSNGAVAYPWHGWQAGTDAQPGEAYDLVCAFEINPDYAVV